MAATAKQRIFDERYKESLYSGERPEENEIIEELLEDYRDLFEKESYLSHGTYYVGHEDDEYLDESTQFVEGSFSIDELVAPFPKRREPLVASNKVHSFSPISEWEGYVTSISQSSFFVSVVNIKDETGLPDDEAEFQLHDLSGTERESLEVGSVVRWVVGFEKPSNDMRQRVSRVHVRRLPAHSVKEYEKSVLEEERFGDGLIWNEPSQT